MNETSTGQHHTPGRYEIRIKGHLNSRWSAWFDGLSLSTESDGSTIIHGPVADQAALHGLLQKVRDVGLPLVSVTQIESDQPDTPVTEPRQLINPPQEIAMTLTAQATPTQRVPMDSTRKTALVAGIFYVITFISIPTLALYGPVKDHRDFITSSGSNTGVLWGCFLEVIVALAGIGTAVTLFPVVKRQNEGMALGFAASRTLEAAMIFIGVASLLSLVTLRQDLGTAAGANAGSLITVGASHVATYNWAFTLGQSLMPGVNALLLGTLMYRSRLVPRVLPVIGLIGAPLHITAVIATMFGLIDRLSPVAGIAVIPVAVWELSLGIYLVVKGFKSCPITDAMRAASTPRVYSDVTV